MLKLIDVIDRLKPNPLKDLIEISKNNSSGSLVPIIPNPPVWTSMGNLAVVNGWIASLPTEGNLRKDSSERFQVVYQMTLKNPEFTASKGNLSAVQ